MFFSSLISLCLWAHWSGDVPRSYIQLHFLSQYLALYCWSEGSCRTVATVPGKNCQHNPQTASEIGWYFFNGTWLQSLLICIFSSGTLPRCWWSSRVSSPCGGSCVGCSCLSAALRVESSSPAAPSAPLLSSSAARPWTSSPSAGPSTATFCPTLRIRWSARCLDFDPLCFVKELCLLDNSASASSRHLCWTETSRSPELTCGLEEWKFELKHVLCSN